MPFLGRGQPLRGEYSDPDLPGKLHTLEQAFKLADAAGFDGVGLVFYPGCGVAALDLDHCLQGVKTDLSEAQKQAVAGVKGAAFLEVSKSGSGLHLIFLADTTTHKANGSVELFGDKNFLALTGLSGRGTARPVGPGAIAAVRRVIDGLKANTAQPVAAPALEPTRSRTSINAEVLQADARPRANGGESLERVQSALDSGMPPQDRDTWMRLVWSVKDAAGDAGRELARAWSARDPENFDDAAFEGVWNSDKAPAGGVTAATLFHWARGNGWVDPTRAASAATTHSVATGDEGNCQPEPWIADMNKRWAVTRLGSGVAVCDLEATGDSPDGGVCKQPAFITIPAFKQLLRGQTVQAGDKIFQKADAWLSSQQRRQYDSGVGLYPPPLKVPPGMLNLWAGYGVEPIRGDVSPWLELLQQLVPDEKARSYGLRWIAWKVQNPAEVPGTILVFTGGKGTGKNSAMEPVAIIFGSAAAVFDDAEQVAGRFTGHLQGLVFVILDEALFAGNVKQADCVKARVTARMMTYERKGLDAVRGINRAAFVSLTNHAHVWHATLDERRAAIMETGSGLVGDKVFWTRYYAWIKAGGASHLLHYLLQFDLSGFDIRAIPKTDALRSQVEKTALRDPCVRWLHDIVNDGELTVRNGAVPLSEDDETVVDKSLLRESFTHSGAGRDSDWTGAAKLLRRVAGDGLREDRPRASSSASARGRRVYLPPLKLLRARFAEVVGVHVDEQRAEG
jgi:hypothetical protein